MGYAYIWVSVMIRQQQVDEVENFCYLGSIISNDDVSDRDVCSRIGMVSGVTAHLELNFTEHADQDSSVQLHCYPNHPLR